MSFKALGYRNEDQDFVVLSSVSVCESELLGYNPDYLLQSQKHIFQQKIDQELFIIHIENVTDIIEADYIEAELTANWNYSLDFNCENCGYVDLTEAPDFFKNSNIAKS